MQRITLKTWINLLAFRLLKKKKTNSMISVWLVWVFMLVESVTEKSRFACFFDNWHLTVAISGIILKNALQLQYLIMLSIYELIKVVRRTFSIKLEVWTKKLWKRLVNQSMVFQDLNLLVSQQMQSFVIVVALLMVVSELKARSIWKPIQEIFTHAPQKTEKDIKLGINLKQWIN